MFVSLQISRSTLKKTKYKDLAYSFRFEISYPRIFKLLKLPATKKCKMGMEGGT